MVVKIEGQFEQFGLQFSKLEGDLLIRKGTGKYLQMVMVSKEGVVHRYICQEVERFKGEPDEGIGF